MTGHLFIISGASGSGKTTLVDLVIDKLDNVARAPKYSERPSRGKGDDTTHIDNIDSTEFDITYVINDFYYGIKTQEIEEQLNSGLNVFIVLSDFKMIARMKGFFPKNSSAIYVSSGVDAKAIQRIMAERLHSEDFNPSKEQSLSLRKKFYKLQCSAQLDRWYAVLTGMNTLLEEWSDVVPYAESARIRAEKIRTFHLRFTDKLSLFDYVILNHTSGKPNDMLLQMSIILEKNQLRHTPSSTKPVLFVVAAASGAGKGLLIETISRLIGPERIGIVTKQALRDAKDNDRRDGLQALGKNGKFSEGFSFEWSFHKIIDKDKQLNVDAHNGTKYAINPETVKAGLDAGINQIVVSNIDTFDRFLKLFGDQVVFLYLHATRPESEVREYQLNNCAGIEEAESRISEIREVHEAYMSNIWRFNHVLLNTSYKEDLFDQMLELENYYFSSKEFKNSQKPIR
jgi:guanylate kinase